MKTEVKKLKDLNQSLLLENDFLNRTNLKIKQELAGQGYLNLGEREAKLLKK